MEIYVSKSAVSRRQRAPSRSDETAHRPHRPHIIYFFLFQHPTVKKGIEFKTERNESSTIRQQITGLTDAVAALHASLTNHIGYRLVVRLTHLMLSLNDQMLAYVHNVNDIH